MTTSTWTRRLKPERHTTIGFNGSGLVVQDLYGPEIELLLSYFFLPSITK